MKILYVTTISLTMNTFFKPHIQMLVDEGHTVDIACNDKDLPIDDLYIHLGCHVHRIDFSRSPLSFDNIKAYGQLKKVVQNGKYDIVHCHTPNASVITRLVCRSFRKKESLKVFYTAHGFHFYKGAPKLNWLVFYPIEKFCSYFTDKLITINKEDYELAKNKFKAKEVHYVPGVGIDLSRFENIQVDRKSKRKEIGVPEDVVLLISVGELSVRKNHKVILNAMSRIQNSNIYYIIVGNGDLLDELQNYSHEAKISNRVLFLGYRKDILELYKASDICCFPSIHEGLPVALMEAMACGLPVICSRIRGNVDLINDNSGFLVDSNNVEGYELAIIKMLSDEITRKKMGNINLSNISMFKREIVLKAMSNIYKESH